MGGCDSFWSTAILFILSIFGASLTIYEYEIIHSLYAEQWYLHVYIHVAVTAIPCLITYLYSLYLVTFWGDSISPMLPFVALWKSAINHQSKIDDTRLYQSCIKRRSTCTTIVSVLVTYLLVMVLLSALCEVLLIVAAFYVAVSSIKQPPKSYYIFLCQSLFLVPNFFMYSAVLFSTPLDSASTSISLMAIYWVLSMLYVTLLVIFCLSAEYPSDLVMLSEWLLLFSIFFIALLIDYEEQHILHALSVAMLVLAGVLDGCFLKAIHARGYVQYSKESELYHFEGSSHSIDWDKLYLIIHHIVYHEHHGQSQPVARSGSEVDVDDEDEEIADRSDANNANNANNENNNKGYRTVPVIERELAEIHEADSAQCIESQHQFMRMEENEKKLQIDAIMANHIKMQDSHRWETQVEKRLLAVYWVLSMIVALYPVLWALYEFLLAKETVIDVSDTREVFVLFVTVLYVVVSTYTLWHFFLNWDKYQIISTVKSIDNVTNENAKTLNRRYYKMRFSVELVDAVKDVEIALVILLYVFGDAQHAGRHKKNRHKIADEPVWMDNVSHFDHDHENLLM